MTQVVYSQGKRGYGAVSTLPDETMMETAAVAAELILLGINLSQDEDEAVEWVKEQSDFEGGEIPHRIFEITVTVTVKATEA